jgi:hypothetical protein
LAGKLATENIAASFVSPQKVRAGIAGAKHVWLSQYSDRVVSVTDCDLLRDVGVVFDP